MSWLSNVLSLDLFTCLLVTTTLLLVYAVYTLLTGGETWEKYGVKHVSLGKLALKDFRKAVVELIEEHGDTIGTNRGQMILLTRDLDLLRQVMVKDFNNFVDRLPVMSTTSAVETGLFFLNGQDWRRVRHVITPSFTNYCMQSLATNTAVLAPFTVISEKVGISLLDMANPDADRYFSSILHTAIAERQKAAACGKDLPKDLLQSLIKAKESGDREAAEFSSVSSSQYAAEDSWDKMPKTMSERELMGQSMLIIFAGFETTATTLQMCLYLLAKHPDIQDKVYREIKEQIASDSPTYEELGQLRFTEQVINETLRLYPPAPIISRLAAKTWHYRGVTVPKGAAVVIALDAIMRDPKNFPDPEKFDPERFSESKSSQDFMAFLPFGHGPRQCIGMRLAYLELKLGLAHVLSKVKFTVSERTQPKKDEQLETRFQGLIIIDKLIQLEVKLR